jgi:hypothetical protein
MGEDYGKVGRGGWVGPAGRSIFSGLVQEQGGFEVPDEGHSIRDEQVDARGGFLEFPEMPAHGGDVGIREVHGVGRQVCRCGPGKEELFQGAIIRAGEVGIEAAACGWWGISCHIETAPGCFQAVPRFQFVTGCRSL